MPDKIKCYLVTTGEDLRHAAACKSPCAFLVYHIGGDGRLARTELPPNQRGSMMGLFDNGTPYDAVDPERLTEDIALECTRRGYGAVLFDFEPCDQSAALLRELAPRLAARKLVLFVPVALASCAPGARLIVPSALSGGSYEEMLRDYAERYGAQNLCLEVVRICSDFSMPAYSSDGTDLTAAQFQQILERQHPEPYFSRELCSKYFTYREGAAAPASIESPDSGVHFLLYDDPSTAEHKIRIAQQCGYRAAFLLYRDWGSASGEIIQAI